MPDAGATGRRVARAQRQVLPSEEDVIRRGTVTAAALVSGRAVVTVDIEGGGEVPGIYCLASYASPAIGDYVIVVGREGSWTCLGQLDEPSWQAYTPVLGNLTVGNGTLIGRYTQVGKTVTFYVIVVFGTTTTIDAPGVSCTVPVDMAITSRQASFFTGILENVGSTSFFAVGFRSAANAFQITALGAGATYALFNSISSTAPFSWSDTDRITIGGTYESV